MTALRHWLCALLLLCAAGGALALAPVPRLVSHVTDEVNMLTQEQRTKLEAVLSDYEAQTGSQIAILLVSSTEPEAIEQYGIRVVDAWKLGRKGIDDGVLILVAKDNPPALRRLRIEAGRGVQGVLTDAQSKRILQDVIAPHFKRSQFYDGLVAGVGAITNLLRGEQFAPPARQGQQHPALSPETADDDFMPPWPLVLIVLLFAWMILRPRRGRSLGRGHWSSGATGFILGAALDSLARGNRGGGFGGGGFDGGGGGGMSGGGGGFDGGGASGDW